MSHSKLTEVFAAAFADQMLLLKVRLRSVNSMFGFQWHRQVSKEKVESL